MNTHKIECGEIMITVAQASLEMGLRRAQLRRADDLVAPERRIWQELTWPDLAASTVAVEGLAWPLDDDQVWALDDNLLSKWEFVVYQMNPHWVSHEPDHANDIIDQLFEWQTQRKSAQNDTAPELPETIRLNYPEQSFRLLQLLEITGWRWPPDVLLRQPEAIMTDLLALAGLNGKIEIMLNRRA
jgi:hypothetical protein